jgi:hypothetical protein
MGRYADMIVERRGLGAKSFVVEVASNDGYLLQYFVAKGIPVLGIEPAANIAKVAVEKGVPTLVEFFGERLARRLAGEGKQADLIAGANALAQVPDVNDFVKGFKILLKSRGVLTIEFYKQGKFLPGTHIPIYAPQKIEETKPDYVLIFPWNFKDEIMAQMAHIRKWGGRFLTPIPQVKVYP